MKKAFAMAAPVPLIPIHDDVSADWIQPRIGNVDAPDLNSPMPAFTGACAGEIGVHDPSVPWINCCCLSYECPLSLRTCASKICAEAILGCRSF